jgi:hypothetical protein
VSRDLNLSPGAARREPEIHREPIQPDRTTKIAAWRRNTTSAGRPGSQQESNMSDIYATDEMKPQFQVGQTVECDLSFAGKVMASCEIVAVLPPRDGEIQYRIKSQSEAFERMVSEYQLRTQ